MAALCRSGRSIFALTNDRDRAYFSRERDSRDQIGYIDADPRSLFGRSYAGEPNKLIKQLAAADRLLLTVPK